MFFDDLFAVLDYIFGEDEKPMPKREKPVEKPKAEEEPVPKKRFNFLEEFCKRVIAQDKVITVFWYDGSKTTVKVNPNSKDKFDYEKGLALAFVKRFFGNNKYDDYFLDMKEIMEKYPHVDTSKAPKKEETPKSEEVVIPSALKKAKDSKTEKKPTEKKSTTKKTSTKKDTEK